MHNILFNYNNGLCKTDNRYFILFNYFQSASPGEGCGTSIIEGCTK